MKRQKTEKNGVPGICGNALGVALCILMGLSCLALTLTTGHHFDNAGQARQLHTDFGWRVLRGKMPPGRKE